MSASNSWAVGLLCGLSSGTTIGMVNYSFGVFIPAWDSEYGWSRTAINGVLITGQVIAFALSPLSGWAVDKHGPRIVGAISAALVSLGFVGVGLSSSLWHLYLSFVLINFGYPGAGTGLVTTKIIGAWFHEARGKVMGLIASCNNLGGLTMSQLATAVLLAQSWQAAAFLFAGIMAVLAPFFWLVVRDRPDEDQQQVKPDRVAGAEKEEEQDMDKGVDVAVEDQSRSSPAPPPPLLLNLDCCGAGRRGAVPPPAVSFKLPHAREPAQEQSGKKQNEAVLIGKEEKPAPAPVEIPCDLLFVSTALGMTLAFWTYPGVLSQIIPALVAEGFSQAAAANTLSLLAVMGVLSKWFFGWLSDHISARLALVGCLVVQCVALGMFVMADEAAVYVVACGLYGAGFGGVGAVLPLVAMETWGAESFGRVYGQISFLNLVPATLGPFIAGQSYDTKASYKPAFGIAVAVFACAAGSLLVGHYIRFSGQELSEG